MEFYKLQVTSKEKLIRNAVKITFAVPENLRSHFRYNAGQYISLKIKGNRREYSLCSSPLDSDLSIGVKAVPSGQISLYLVNKLQVGDSVEVSRPYGFFGISNKPGSKRTILAFAGGSGITPILSIARYILQTEAKADFLLFYFNKSTESVMFYDELNALQLEYPTNFQLYFSYTQQQSADSLFKGRMTADNIQFIIQRLRGNSNLEKVLICGPDSMRKKITDVAKGIGIDVNDVHYERYTADNDTLTTFQAPIAIDPSEEVLVSLTKDGVTRQLTWNKQKPLLQALLNAGIDAPYSCARGQCGTCVCKLEEGEVRLRRNFVLLEPHLQSGLILPCVAVPVSERIKINYDDF